MATYKGFGERLAQERREKAARERRDLLQKDVAAALGTSAATVSRWEDGVVIPRDVMLEKLASYFGVTLGWLRYGQEPREAPRHIPVQETLIEDEPDVMTEPPPGLGGSRSVAGSGPRTGADRPGKRRHAG